MPIARVILLSLERLLKDAVAASITLASYHSSASLTRLPAFCSGHRLLLLSSTTMTTYERRLLLHQLVIFSALFIGYACYAYNRKSVSAAMPTLISEGLGKSQAGEPATLPVLLRSCHLVPLRRRTDR